MFVLIAILQVISGLGLIFLVLLHSGKGGGLSDMMERTLFGKSWLTVGRVLSLVPLSIGVAVLSKRLLGEEVDPLGIANEV